MHRQHPQHCGRVHMPHTAHCDLTDGGRGPRYGLERHLGRFGRCVRVEVAEHFGPGIATIAQPAREGVGRRLKQEAVEGVADLQRQGATQPPKIERRRVEPEEVELRHPQRLAFGDAERYPHILRGPPHQRIHHRVHVAALTVQQQQADHVTPEFQLVEIATLPQPEPAQPPFRGEGAGASRGDRRAERIVVDGMVADEG